MEISIITVTKNRKDLLLRKLESIENQTLDKSDYELILLNNNSTDGTSQILSNRNFRKLNISIINLSTEVGISQARNICIEKAQGKYIYLSDDDCLLPPTVLEEHLHILEKQNIVTMGSVLFEDDIEELWIPRKQYWYLTGQNTALPRIAALSIGGFDEDLKQYGGEDILFAYLLKLSGYKFEVLKNVYVRHIGPNATKGKDLSKAYKAGKNAVLISKKYPRLAFRLGTASWLLVLKRLIYLSPLRYLLKNILGRYGYERAYLMGVLEQKQMMEEENV